MQNVVKLLLDPCFSSCGTCRTRAATPPHVPRGGLRPGLKSPVSAKESLILMLLAEVGWKIEATGEG